MAETLSCKKCGRQLKETEFYTDRNKKKLDLCKKCMTMHVDNFDPQTFLWILQQVDIPYVPNEWEIIRNKAIESKGPDSLNGMSVVGKYISKMKLKQWKDYHWEDTDKLMAQLEERQKAQMAEQQEYLDDIKEKYENGEISEAEYKTLATSEEKYNNYLNNPSPVTRVISDTDNFNEANFLKEDDVIPDLAKELTDDDRKALAIKWGRLYKPTEWIELESMYTEMMNSFDIQDADTINTLILLCKTNLKMNQAIDIGDLDGFQKLSKVSESLRKTAKFTAAQNKEQKNDYVDSVGELVAMCEREGFIPRYATDIPQDKVDITLKDMNTYLNKLVTQDLGFGQQIEDALKKIQIQKEMNEAQEAAEDGEVEMTDEDFMDFYDEIAEQKAADELTKKGEE